MDSLVLALILFPSLLIRKTSRLIHDGDVMGLCQPDHARYRSREVV
jgi:hypothetical protein